MFEKEIEERFIKSYPQFCCNGKPLSPFWDLWEAGIEFAYNKANEWHFVDEEEWEEEQAIEGIYEEMWDTMWGKEPKDPRQRSELRKRAREKYYRMLEEEEADE